MVKIACDLDDASFIKVAPVVLLYPPLSNNSIICSGVCVYSYINPYILTDPSFYYLIDIPLSLFLYFYNIIYFICLIP